MKPELDVKRCFGGNISTTVFYQKTKQNKTTKLVKNNNNKKAIYKAFNLWKTNQECNLAFSYLQFEDGCGNRAKPTVSDLFLWLPDRSSSLPC